ncbi:hypothetical protein [Desulfovibrio sp. JC010]|uniref:hypothetical protein n=1 Tax=Desulfovibrio sp. JC010 TaxID=2593641 RepID=UPI0013CFED0F|nr:hypothetical protein [Desulfovibrio sp. JC010]NDV27281.1 hypothetical protein [Desulfovibrio sp. JC010]
MKKVIFLLAIYTCALFCTAPAYAQSTILKAYSFNKKKASNDWSPRKTFMVGENRRLGLFNDRNKRYPSKTVLTLSGLPTDADLKLEFDMVFVGSWDNEGKLADKFIVSAVDGPELLNMTEFPCTLIDNNDSRPVGNDGWVRVGPKERAYWIKPMTVKIPAAAIKEGSIEIQFKGFLTGRKTEFWALDNVQILLGN